MGWGSVALLDFIRLVSNEILRPTELEMVYWFSVVTFLKSKIVMVLLNTGA